MVCGTTRASAYTRHRDVPNDTDRALRSQRPVTVIFTLVLTVSCGQPDDAPSSIQLAPERCPPDPVSHEADPWTDWERIRLPNGRMLELRGCRSAGAGWLTYDYHGAAPGSHLHLVHYQLYEGDGWIVVDPRTGLVQRVSGAPVFSPDGSWFATGVVDLLAQYNRSHLDIWRVNADTIQRVLRLDGDGEWGAAGLRWVSDDTLEYERIARVHERDLWLDTTHMRAVRRGTEWESEPRN